MVNETNSVKNPSQYLAQLDNTLQTLPHSQDNPLYEDIQALYNVLYNELNRKIKQGQTDQQINNSETIKVAQNTVQFIDTLYNKTKTQDELIQCCKQYIKNNSHYGRHWSLVSRIVAGTLLCVIAVPALFYFGGIIGANIAVIGALSPIEFLGRGLLGELIGLVIGLFTGITSGIGGSIYFFHPGREREIKALGQTAIASFQSKENEVDSYGEVSGEAIPCPA